MPYAPLISKIRCHNPNLSKAKVCNRNYITYIGTREGVDLTEPTFEKLIQEQLIAGAASDDEIENYAQNSASNETYVKYIAERPKSHGLFGNISVNDITKLSNHIAYMTKHGKNIYRGIVSLSEKDALNLGYDKKETWMRYMKSVMPDIGNQFGIKIENLSWCAAVHMEKGHPHCHYMFWDTTNKIRSSYIHTSVQNKCRQLLSKEMFQEERQQEILNKTTTRDFILEFGKTAFADLKKDMTHERQSHIPGKMSAALSKELQAQFHELIKSLPSSGRITYKFMTPEIKSKVDNIINLLFSHPDLQREVEKYYEASDRISDTLSSSAAQKEWSKNKAKIDLEKRIGNIILTAAKETKKEFSRIDYRNERSEEYKKMCQKSLIKFSCYSVFTNIFSALVNENNQRSDWTPDKTFRTHSKENMKIQARLGINRGEESEPDQE